MPFCTLDEDYWDTLILAIQQQQCILMLGPDASVEQSGDSFVPCTEVLADEMVDKINSKVEWNIVLNPTNFMQVSQYYSMIYGRKALESKIRTFYQQRQHETCHVHQLLSSLPFYFIITSTPDQMFYNALKEAGKDPLTAYYHFQGEQNVDSITMGTEKNPLIFNLLGKIDYSDPLVSKSLVLTEDNLMSLLVTLYTDERPLPANVKSELMGNKDKCFLFLGFGFKHWYLRILLYALKLGKQESYSFALEEISRISKNYINEFHRTIIYFQKTDYKIQFIDCDMDSFVSELNRRFKQATPLCKPKKKDASQIREDAPVVFICHANEDKDKAEDLYGKLKDAGLRPWLDKENLRGGDQWDKVIEKTIKEEIDYFIVLQTEALSKKLYGYVNKEITIALNQQDYYRRLQFIIPVKAEECEQLEDLNFLHTVDISDISSKELKEGLVKTIERDYKIRKKKKITKKRWS